MKKSFILLVGMAVGILTQSCVYVWENSISGNGNVRSETRRVDDFHGIEAAAGLKVYVTFGEMMNEVEVEADENLHEYIETEVIGGILKIRTRKGIRNAKARNIYVNAGKIDHLEASSAAHLLCENILDTRAIEIDVSSAADLELHVEADRIEINVSSSGNARIEGRAYEMYAEVSSAGTLRASDLEVKDCVVEASSAGNARVFVTEKLEAGASSAGHISYRGSPNTKQIRKTSAGTVSGS